MRKILIIEDEQISAKRLCRLIDNILNNTQLLSVLDSVEESLLWFDSNPQPDLVFMDLQLSDGTAVEILNKIDFRCPVVIASAYYDEYLSNISLKTYDISANPYSKKIYHQYSSILDGLIR